MTEPRPARDKPPESADFEEDLDADISGREREDLLSFAVQLAEDRPVPRAGMRSAIRSRLLSGGRSASPSRIRALIYAYGSSGAVLLAVAAAGLVGLGPFSS